MEAMDIHVQLTVLQCAVSGRAQLRSCWLDKYDSGGVVMFRETIYSLHVRPWGSYLEVCDDLTGLGIKLLSVDGRRSIALHLIVCPQRLEAACREAYDHNPSFTCYDRCLLNSVPLAPRCHMSKCQCEM